MTFDEAVEWIKRRFSDPEDSQEWWHPHNEDAFLDEFDSLVLLLGTFGMTQDEAASIAANFLANAFYATKDEYGD